MEPAEIVPPALLEPRRRPPRSLRSGRPHAASRRGHAARRLADGSPAARLPRPAAPPRDALSVRRAPPPRATRYLRTEGPGARRSRAENLGCAHPAPGLHGRRAVLGPG